MAIVRAFVADIPATLSDEALAKIYTWSRDKFERRDIAQHEDGSYVLGALVPEGQNKNVRDWQRLIRTNLLNWGVEMPKQQKGWLRAVTLEQYESLVTNCGETVSTTTGSDGTDQERDTESACTSPLVPDGHDVQDGDEQAATPGPKEGGASRGPITGDDGLVVEASPTETANVTPCTAVLRLRPPLNLLARVAAC